MLLDFNHLKEKYNMNIKGMIHIGAHHGQEHTLYKQNKISNIVYFEPLKSNFEILEKNVNGDALLFNIALGNENKEIEMFVETANMGQSSSILEPMIHTQQYPHIVFDKKEVVSMKKLDNVDLDIELYNFINIDVQGYELEVFKGATNALEKIDYIISEINRDELYKNCSQVSDLQAFLLDFGFHLVEESWIGGNWGDGLFIKIKK